MEHCILLTWPGERQETGVTESRSHATLPSTSNIQLLSNIWREDLEMFPAGPSGQYSPGPSLVAGMVNDVSDCQLSVCHVQQRRREQSQVYLSPLVMSSPVQQPGQSILGCISSRKPCSSRAITSSTKTLANDLTYGGSNLRLDLPWPPMNCCYQNIFLSANLEMDP